MKTSPLFRFRLIIIFAIVLLGFLAPWEPLLLGRRHSAVWVQLPLFVSQRVLISFAACDVVLTALLIALALAAALLRTWGAAYLGTDVVRDSQLHSHSVVADGPFRHVRNPLYIGSLLHFLALAILMPPAGAVFTVIMTAIFYAVLAREEESRLLQQAGPAFAAYRAKVPAWLPSLLPRVAPSGRRPQWAQAAFGEIYMWGAAITFATLAWTYNPQLLFRGILISFGLSLIADALMRKQRP